MPEDEVIDLFQGINVVRPSEQVVMQIRRLIAKGRLKPGDMLPPERSLSEKLGISRGQVREGIKTLELYGFVKSIQGRGTVVSDLGMRTMSDMLGNLLKLTSEDIQAFVDTRILLETHTARLAAANSTREDKDALLAITRDMREVGDDLDRWLETDLSLHVKIAEASHNPVLLELIKFMTPNVVGYYRKFFRDKILNTAPMHETIVQRIVDGDGEGAAALMHQHMRDGLPKFLNEQAAVKAGNSESGRRKKGVPLR